MTFLLMDKPVSLHLDLIRIIATLVVVLSHFSFAQFSGNFLTFIHPFGHTAVMVFFVLSGYVIAYVTDQKEHNASTYFISRFGRLYSVVLPVLILVPVLDYTGNAIDPAVYKDRIQDSHAIIRFVANLFFAQEFWSVSLRYFSNGPLWSLGYEFWYYVLFGGFVFLSGLARYSFLLFVSVLIGYKILLLLPVWLTGVLIYNIHQRYNMATWLARLLLLLLPLFCIAFYYSGLIVLFDTAQEKLANHVTLAWSQNFLVDYITGIAIGFYILIIPFLKLSFFNGLLLKSEKIIRFTAASTFSIYVFHFPLLLFFSALLQHNPESYLQMAFLLGITLATCIIIARYTEHRKKHYKQFFQNIFDVVRVMAKRSKSYKLSK